MEDQNCPLNSVTTHIIYVSHISSFVILCINHVESVNFPNSSEFAAATSLIELLSIFLQRHSPWMRRAVAVRAAGGAGGRRKLEEKGSQSVNPLLAFPTQFKSNIQISPNSKYV
jgi:hypothetical protein|eukprot:COSAG06_NODE_1887_length_8141_cov_11.312609_12_plen_114_part_00